MCLRFIRFSLILIGLQGAGVQGDQCALFDKDVAEKLARQLEAGGVWLQYCEPCNQQYPHPLTIKDVEFHKAQEARERAHRFGGEWYSDEDVIKGRVPGMDEWLRADIMEMLEKRPIHSVTIQNRRIDPGYLYRPVGDDLYRNVGVELGCASGLESITYMKPDRSAGPPPPSVAREDITDNCYDGCCIKPDQDRFTLTVRTEATLFKARDTGGEILTRVGKGEKLRLLRVVSEITPVKVAVVRDHGPFLAGDDLYLLNSLGEGFYRVWHYGRILEVGMTGVSTFFAGSADQSACPAGENDCWAEVPSHDNERWWAEVITRDGQRGWLVDPQKVVEGLFACS